MSISLTHSHATEPLIAVPAIGLRLCVRLAPGATSQTLTIIETENAPGFGPPLHRHREAEIFHVLEGRYLFEVDGKRFHAEAGDVVSVPGSAAHAFLNVTDRPARQFILITPGFDALGFFTGLGDLTKDGTPPADALNAFGEQWKVEFLGPPLKVG